MSSTLLMTKDDRKIYRLLVNWMKSYLLEAQQDGDPIVNTFGVGEVNTTLLAEDAAYNSGLLADPDDAIDDETHVLWDAAVDAGEWYEANV